MADREAFISSAIEDVEMEFEIAAQQKVELTETEEELLAFKAPSPEALAQGTAALKFERTVKHAEKKLLLGRRQAAAQTAESIIEELATEVFHTPGTILSAQEVKKIYDQSGCTQLEPPSCDSQEKLAYRSADGTCNNLQNPTLGAALTPLRRLIPSRYDDGVSRPVGFLQSQGSRFSPGPFTSPHPSPRVVSTRALFDRDIEDTKHTHMLMQWGQFVDHDIGFEPMFKDCPKTCVVKDNDEGKCFPYAVPRETENIMATMANSMNCGRFERSIPSCPSADHFKSGESLPPREQLNEITHYIDASTVYGFSEKTLYEILDPSTGFVLKTGKNGKCS